MLEQLKDFLEFMNHPKARDFCKLDSVKRFAETLKDTHIFKVNIGSDVDEELNKPIESLDCLSLPFADNFIIAENAITNFVRDSRLYPNIEFLGFSVQELAPNHIQIVSVAKMDVEGMEEKFLFPFSFSIIGGKVGIGDSPLPWLYETCIDLGTRILLACLNRINKQVFTLVENEDKIDFKTRALGGYTRLKIKPSYIIYLGTEKSLLKSHPDLSNKILRNKPEFSWAVRGHWRRLSNPDSIGKDRNGDYKVKAFTWVSDYIKGEGELVKKIRVVK